MQKVESQDDAIAATRSTFYGLITVLRPHQWSKNLLIFVGLIFSRSLSDWHNISVSLAAFLLFCAASSGIYIFNDLCDLEADKTHPSKRLRPLPAGLLNLNLARLVMTLLFVTAAVGALWLNYGFAVIIGTYLLLNLAYSLGLKRAVILDVMLIAAGFVLRAIAGAVVLNVEVSNWLVLCTSMLALLIGFGKRRHELSLLGENANSHRQTLNDYSFQFLDSMMTICGGAAVVTYALYTMADETVARFKTRNLLLTLPFVIYGIFRYLFRIYKKDEGGDPVSLLFQDRPMIINILLWILTVCAVIYAPVIRQWIG